MQPSFTPLKFLILMFAGWMSRHQLDVIEYLREENRVLKELWSAKIRSAAPNRSVL